MPKMIAGWCKPHFNPLTVLLLGGCAGVMLAVPFMSALQWNDFLYKWQSILGAAISTAIAVGLFQHQRRLDLERERASFRFHLTRALKQVSTHPAKIQLDIASMKIEECRVTISRLKKTSPWQILRTTVPNALHQIQEVCGVFADILASIPRNAYFDDKLTDEVDEFDNAFRTYIFALRLIHDHTQSDDWNRRKEDYTPCVIFDAQQVIADITNALELIDTQIKVFETKPS